MKTPEGEVLLLKHSFDLWPYFFLHFPLLYPQKIKGASIGQVVFLVLISRAAFIKDTQLHTRPNISLFLHLSSADTRRHFREVCLGLDIISLYVAHSIPLDILFNLPPSFPILYLSLFLYLSLHFSVSPCPFSSVSALIK
jgi:hypothetical protein